MGEPSRICLGGRLCPCRGVHKNEYGNLLVPAQYRSPDGYALGRWISNLRQQRANGERQNLLNEERVAQLDKIGMVWDAVSERWEQNYVEALHYYSENGSLDVPAAYKAPSGFALGAWLRNLRRLRRDKPEALSPEQIARLDAIGMSWGTATAPAGWLPTTPPNCTTSIPGT